MRPRDLFTTADYVTLAVLVLCVGTLALAHVFGL